MSNQKQAFHDAAKIFVETVTNAAPIILCLTLAATFFMYAQFQAAYYITLFTPHVPTFAAFAGYGIAAVFFAIRLGLGLATANNFYDGRTWAGFMNLGLSIGAATFEAYESKKMAAIWAGDFSAPLLALNIGGLVLEAALIFTVFHGGDDGAKPEKKTEKKADRPATATQFELPFFTKAAGN